jgi:hypothetical protein
MGCETVKVTESVLPGFRFTVKSFLCIIPISHTEGTPTGAIAAILFHNLFETGLWVVTTPKTFHKMLRTFTTEASFFSVLPQCVEHCSALSPSDGHFSVSDEATRVSSTQRLDIIKFLK